MPILAEKPYLSWCIDVKTTVFCVLGPVSIVLIVPIEDYVLIVNSLPKIKTQIMDEQLLSMTF